jgi:hypothetical protein
LWTVHRVAPRTSGELFFALATKAKSLDHIVHAGTLEGGSGSGVCEVAKEAIMRRINEYLLPVVTAVTSAIMFAAVALM